MALRTNAYHFFLGTVASAAARLRAKAMEDRQPTPPPPDRRERRPKAALDYLLAGSSVKTNPYLAAFAKSAFVRALQEDSSYESLRKFANIKKEVTEVGRLHRVRTHHNTHTRIIHGHRSHRSRR